MDSTMKKIIIALCILPFLSCFSREPKNDNTRKKEDTVYLKSVITKMINENISPFYNKSEFDSKTEIFVDDLIYSRDSCGIVVLVITKNLNTKLLAPDDIFDSHYNGHYLFCKRESINKPIKVFTYSSVEFTHYKAYNRVKNALHNECFRYRSKHMWNEKEPLYNIDDNRFWTSQEFIKITSDTSFVQLNN